MTSTPPPEPVQPTSRPQQEDDESAEQPTTEPYIPPSIPYSEAFENSIMNAFLNPHGSFAPPPYAPDHSAQPPSISQSELPLALHDYRRVHPSFVNGILLSHPSHTLHGAPGPTEDQLLQLAQELVQKHGIRNEAQFVLWLDTEETHQRRELRERMRRRQSVLRENENVRQEVDRLDMERDMERRVAERWRTRNRSGGAADGKEEDDESSDSDIGGVM